MQSSTRPERRSLLSGQVPTRTARLRVFVPYVDPDSGAIQARVLWVSPAPASVASAYDVLGPRGIRVINAPHPSPIPAAATRGRSLEEFNAAVTDTYAAAMQWPPDRDVNL